MWLHLKQQLLLRFYYIVEILYIKINRLFPVCGYILMYHHVTDDDICDNPDCIRKTKDFEKTIIDYKERGYEFVNIDRVLSAKPCCRKFVVVTFDDGTKDFLLNAYPFLKQNEIPFTIYLSNSFIGKKDFLTEDDVQLLSKDSLCIIGYHTYSHYPLIKTDDCERELFEGKKQLECLINKEIKFFAYPFGKLYMVGFKSIFKVGRKDYVNAVGTINCPVTKFSMFFPYYLPRIVS